MKRMTMLAMFALLVGSAAAASGERMVHSQSSIHHQRWGAPGHRDEPDEAKSQPGEPIMMDIEFAEPMAANEVITRAELSGVKLLSLSSSLPDFYAVYTLDTDETVQQAIKQFSTDVEETRQKLIQRGIAARSETSESSVREISIGSMVIAGTRERIDAFSSGHEIHAVRVPVDQPALAPPIEQLGTNETGEMLKLESPGAVPAFAPTVGVMSYDGAKREFYSEFSWSDVSWANGKVGFEHDIAVLGGKNDFVVWGVGTYATNLQNAYQDDTFLDTKAAMFTVGVYPANVTANKRYFVRIPVKVVSKSKGPRPLNVIAELTSRNDSHAYCKYKKTTASCMFPEAFYNEDRFFVNREPATPLFSRILFDATSSWTYQWDTGFGFDAKQCPDSMYRGRYVNDFDLDLLPFFVRCDNAISFDWGKGGPGLGIGSDRFGIRWTRNLVLLPATHRFEVESDDGIRVWIDNIQKVNEWHSGGTDGKPIAFTASLDGKPHALKVEYFEKNGNARVILRTPLTPPTAPREASAASSVPKQMQVQWIDASTDETTFRVDLKPPGADWREMRSVAGNVTSVKINDLVAGAKYGARVKACNDGGCSAYSNEAFVTIKNDAGAPACYVMRALAVPPAGGYPVIHTPFNCNNSGYTSGTSVSISANAYSGYRFSHWASTNCTLANQSGASTTCMVSGNGIPSVTANFTPAATYALQVSLAGGGSGSVMSTPAGINCGGECSKNCQANTNVKLTAVPAPGSAFAGWSGCDSTAGMTCSVTMTGNKAVSASFAGTPSYLLEVRKVGSGNGAVASNVAGILCGADCSEQYSASTNVTLAAGANDGSVFSSWSGCDSTDGIRCYVTMTNNRTVTAAFTVAQPPRERITNGSFTSGSAGWNMYGDFWIGTNLGNYRTSPGYAAGGVTGSGQPKNSSFGYIYQTFSIPSNATTASLAVWINITSEETTTSPVDVVNVTLQDQGGNYLAGVCTKDNTHKRSSSTDYRVCSLDILQYRGRSLRVNIVAATDGARSTVFRIDDVSVMADGN